MRIMLPDAHILKISKPWTNYGES